MFLSRGNPMCRLTIAHHCLVTNGADFWARVEALGDEAYHLPIDMTGMPGR